MTISIAADDNPSPTLVSSLDTNNSESEFVEFSIGRFRGHLLHLTDCVYIWLKASSSTLEPSSNILSIRGENRPHLSTPLILAHPPKLIAQKGSNRNTDMANLLRAVHVRGMSFNQETKSFKQKAVLDEKEMGGRPPLNTFDLIPPPLTIPGHNNAPFSQIAENPAITALTFERFAAALAYRSGKVILLAFSGGSDDGEKDIDKCHALDGHLYPIQKDGYLGGGTYSQWGPIQGLAPTEQAMLIKQLCYLLAEPSSSSSVQDKP